MLVQGVAGDKSGLGYFGFSYYEQNTGQAEPRRRRRRRRLHQAVDARRSRTARYKPLARPLFMYPSEGRWRGPEVKAFIDFVVANYGEIAENAQIVPMTDAQAARPRPTLDKAERERTMEAATAIAARRPGLRSWAPRRVAGARTSSRALLFCAALVSVLTTVGIVVSLLRETLHFFGDGADRRVPVRDRVVAAVRRRRVRRAAADHRHAAHHRHRAARRDPARARRRDLPQRVRDAARPRSLLKPVLELLAGMPDDRLRLLRADVLHADDPERPPRARRPGVQRAERRASSWASWSCRRSRRSPRTRCRPCRRRCARAPTGSARTSCRSRLRVVFPAALSGIVAAVVLGISRAIGETMIVLVAAGPAAQPDRRPARVASRR